MISSYKDLNVWKRGIEIAKKIYTVTTSFPKCELFCLVSQMRRSSISISSNIAEGWMRQYTKEYIQFLYHSLGSCGELETQIVISEELKYFDRVITKELIEDLNHIERMLWKLIKSLKCI